VSPCDAGIDPYADDRDDLDGAAGRKGLGGLSGLAGLGGLVGAALRVPAALRDGRAAPNPPFDDPAWSDSLPWWLLGRGYEAWRGALLAAAGSAWVPAGHRRRVQFLTRVLTEALAPTNFPLTDPAALRRAVDSGGTSVTGGLRNMRDDVLRRKGRPAKTHAGDFRMGVDLAATPGRVVHRSESMELIQYTAQTETVFETPLLFVPAWVNKFYIFDLAPGRSLVDWAVKRGFTVFCLSLRDPRHDGGLPSLDAYFTQCLRPALEAISDITSSPRAHLAGACAGGFLATALAAWLEGSGRPGAASLTLLMTALTTTPGGPGGFASGRATEGEIRLLSRLLARDEQLIDGAKLSLLFDLLKAETTIWGPLRQGWLQGDRAPAFDLLAWSEDTIDVARSLFEETLRLAARDSLANGSMTLDGRPVQVSAVRDQDTFVVAAERDHIIPWSTVYQGARLIGEGCHFHLVPSGHMGGIVNPPRPTARHRTAPGPLPATSAQWLTAAQTNNTSWWDSWTTWLAERSGSRIAAHEPGSTRYPARQPAPGRHVLRTEEPGARRKARHDISGEPRPSGPPSPARNRSAAPGEPA
jgi:polyhydroxyalkanoate synthase subunit PhaC